MSKSQRIRFRWISIGLVGLGVIVTIILLPMRDLMVRGHGLIQDMGAMGMVLYGLLYVIATLMLIPGFAISLAAGLIFGLLWGTVTAAIASTAGAALAFLIARYVARDRVVRIVERHPRFRAVDRAVSEGSWKIVALLRLSPVIPFGVQNYLYGLTGIRFWPCILASCIAMLPGTFISVYLGYLARAGVESAVGDAATTVWMWVLRIVGLCATVAVMIHVTARARSAIRRQMQTEEMAEAGETR